MMLWIAEFEDTEEQATSTSFKLIVNEFKNAVNLTHVEWLRLARADSIKFYSDLSNPDDFTEIAMTQKGWPKVVPSNIQGCNLLWQKLLKQPLQVIHKNIIVKYQNNTCIFQLNSQQQLSYQVNNGQVDYINSGVKDAFQ
ncbi:hypothetical protein N7931_05385 [Catenovulum sp. 2E275]|uniref:hypothetical protein n=1 Tax=Catenovulum sp. 2E275 TaxID=2980497 RepID=UPI0021D3B187|nr:hypothetical protein [Catenovulum sp. 2E275]MCU4675062.1 hypothetical protein [Catenovulum sp. 2E275]